MSVKGDARTLFWVVRIRYRNFSGPFLVYMLVLYNKIRKLNQIFPVKPIPAALMHEIIEKNGLPFCDDANNTVIVHKQFLSECGVGGFMKIGGSSRLVYVIGTKTEQNFALVTHDLDVNLKRKQVKLQPIQRLRVATEITISLVSIPHDLGNFSVDTLVKNYFHTPKIVTRGDVIAVDFKKYAPEIFYTQLKWNDVGVVFFKCNKIHYKNQEMKSAVCKIGETAIKQSANVQSFVAPASKIFTFYFDDNTDYDDRMIDSCPWGLKTHLEALERAVRPFLTKNKVRLKLAFLLQGKKGVGKKEIVASLAAKLGLHLFSVTSGEVSASVYAQTETKIRNVFFRTRLCSPCILCIDNFENFGRNNEGQHDERIMSFFETQLETLFSNNAFPIILICASNTKDVPQQLSRAFLEIFEVPAPSQAQRLDLLRWIFEKNCLTGCNIERAAEKTQGFLFEDLQALIFHARRDSGGWGIFTDRDVDNALGRPPCSRWMIFCLDLMQARHNQSLGAPRVPKVQWSDVGGLAEVKEEIIRTINLPLRHPELLKSSGLRRSGILLYGPPGTGKTLLAKAVATECNLCFLSVKGPELLNMYVGQSEQNVREVFERAREASPCIIFFDELDSLAPNRGVSGDSGGVMDRVVSQLLAEMDGLSQSATIFIIGATNRPDLIDPALLRPGRFDKLLYVGPCVDLKSKVGVLKALTRKFKLRDVDLEEVVKVCPPNITGADFYGLCSNAWMSAARRVIWRIENEGLKDATQDDVQVTMDDFQAALKDLKPSIRAEDLMYFEKLERQFSKTKT